MSKAVLVIEMPQSCMNCKLKARVHGESNIAFCCNLAEGIITLEDGFKKRLDNCPLVPVPDKKPFIGIDAIKSDFLSGRIDEALHEAARLGWNACLDAICGE